MSPIEALTVRTPLVHEGDCKLICALVLDGGLEAGEADRVRPKDRHSER
jgi:hypothetical protein